MLFPLSMEMAPKKPDIGRNASTAVGLRWSEKTPDVIEFKKKKKRKPVQMVIARNTVWTRIRNGCTKRLGKFILPLRQHSECFRQGVSEAI